ncbi:MAG: arsenate reductase ArsC [Phycisphaeraceae bacterium]|nr:arsenate reductase ArsC [Phycisphaeraceae bacterium]
MALINSVLFVCSHNSARSQMAEGWLRHLASDRFKVYSAGVEPGALNPLAVKAMAEVGVDISAHKAKGIEVYLGRVPIYHLIIVCDKASQTCPRIWPGARQRQFWPFDDPSAATGSEHEKLEVFRRVRDEILARIEQWLTELDESSQPEVEQSR